MKLRFALKFLATFTLVIPLWWAVDAGALYRSAMLAVAGWVSPLFGWWLQVGADGVPEFRRAGVTLPFYLDLATIAMGLMPLWSLIVATPFQSARRIAACLPAAVVLYFLVDLAVVLTYPFILDRPNFAKDTLGVFSGLIAFVVAPLGVWFLLTYPALNRIWQLGGPPSART